MNYGQANGDSPVPNMKNEIENFLRNLANNAYWGGSETIQAASDLFTSNVPVINDLDGGFYFLAGFDTVKPRIIVLAYRKIGSGKDRNHLDSVVDIDRKILYT